MNHYRVSRYLSRRRRKNVGQFPQLACFAFDSIGSQIMLHGRYEDELLVFLEDHVFSKLQNRRVCLDIGANIGNHSVAFADSFEQVIAFEPNPEVFALLELNARLKHNIVTISHGASEREHTLLATVWRSNIGSATVEPSQAERASGRGAHSLVPFSLKPVDVLVDRDLFGKVDFVKVDVEGHELSALKGARDLLETNHPVIALELLRTGFEEGQHPVSSFLEDLGYKFVYELFTPRMKQRKFRRWVSNWLPDKLIARENVVQAQRLQSIEVKDYPMLLFSPVALDI